MPGDVAICIPTYNQAEHLGRAVESAEAQDYEGAVEIWIGDDASTDATPQVLDRLEAENPAVHVLRQERNVGIAENSSAVMRGPRTEYLVRLDSDDELEPRYLSRLVELMEAHPDAGYGHTAITQIDAAGAVIDTRRLLRGTGYQDADASLRASLSGYRTVANILIFRRAALERLNFYEGGPPMRQDYDLAVRMADAGFGNVYVDEPLARYRVWTDAAGVRARRKAQELEGYIHIFDRSFTPAWQRRGWDLGELAAQRRRLSRHHCQSCFSRQYDPEDRRRLVALLRRLGDSRRLSARIMICEAGGARWLARQAAFNYRTKSTVKVLVKFGARARGAR